MKLLKSAGCQLPVGGGNSKELTMIVEVQGMGFWTRVRLPSAPFEKDFVSKETESFFSLGRTAEFLEL